MKPFPNRLICRAPNRFTPSIVLWQHFVGPNHHTLYHQRLSSHVTEAVQNAAGIDHATVSPQETSGLSQLKAESGQEQGSWSIRRTTTGKGEWRKNKRDVTISRNIAAKKSAQQDRQTASEKLLADARAAFDAAEDYKGVVVEPMVHPASFRESSLPWCLPTHERTMSGIDRLAVEIDRFYAYTKPDYFEAMARRHVIEQVRSHVRETLPNHVLEVFGSERTGLAMATSDIDFRLLALSHLEAQGQSNTPPPPTDRREAMKSLRELYNRNLSRKKAYLLAQLRYARYPLISLQDQKSRLDVQIVLSNDTTLSRDMMKGYMEEYPYLRPLFFVVKTMFDVRGLADVFRGGFGSYSLFMMLVASIKHKPHPRKDAAGALINFLKFYRNFDTTKDGISIEPLVLFDKKKEPVLSDTVKAKLAEGDLQPLPDYMLCLRDPADATNDLGRKGIAIKHVQATFRQLCFELDHDLARNTRHSQLGILVGTSYMLNKEQRENLRHYGHSLARQLQTSLAKTANMVKQQEQEAKIAEEASKGERDIQGKESFVRLIFSN
ncbi:hypothetical protein FB567DRAFT_264407 [Paraphoma chrysanthemicola]|uniref:Poly(A) RNA polymerase mitochondrial-like central palm domain-containing protein n=1 Tax=Paraphoma chrysanthemicola TaxID=798071 RepID=A0A8K0REI5_9PLEO|nr:hypothetical protein FB567DRAFT_264407 [Paraphoma chrysanthemicola]